ncbi:MAG: helix-turn-helix domain-containing protein, partial [Alphaproteobacteria bacterium]
MSDSPSLTSSGGFDSFEQKLGDELRGERATLGKSLLDVQRELHVKAAYISAIENCDVSVFPNASFVSGYVRSYARYLWLDSEETFARFCVEARFQSTSSELGMKKPSKKSN